MPSCATSATGGCWAQGVQCRCQRPIRAAHAARPSGHPGHAAQPPGGCGPTQHLLANLVDVDTPEDDSAEGDALLVSSRTAVRASHRGAGEKAAQTYECMGYYHDRWAHTPAGWRIAHRKMVVGFEFGSRSVLAPPTGAGRALTAALKIMVKMASRPM